MNSQQVQSSIYIDVLTQQSDEVKYQTLTTPAYITAYLLSTIS